MASGGWIRGAKLSFARLGARGPVPEGPVYVYRDPWKGDAAQGARLVAGRFRFDRAEYVLTPGRWGSPSWPRPVRDWFDGFSWLRDLRMLGTDEARLAARALIAEWLGQSAGGRLTIDATVTGERLAAWLCNHEFCMASADRRLQRRLMERMQMEARTVAALLPLPPSGWRGLCALRGLLAASLAMPEQTGFMSRFLRYLPAEIDRLALADGTVAERSPEAQFQAARELTEMSVMFRTAHSSLPPLINTALDRLCPVLRAMRHGDGGLAVFNGAGERRAEEIEDVLALGSRQRLVAPAMPEGKFIRVALGKALLIVDAGPPPPASCDRAAHAGTLSFEFSHHRHRLFVNCGSALTGPWEAALRRSAAHTLLVADGHSSSDFGADGRITRRPAHVTSEHQTDGKAHWLDLSHDGYHPVLGVKWTRRLYLGAEGEDLRGQEVLEGERLTPFALRFHVHPEVSVTRDDEDVILRAGGTIWRFRQKGGVLAVEDDVYLARGERETARQIVVTQLPGGDGEEAGAEKGEGPRRFTRTVTWLLERIPE